MSSTENFEYDEPNELRLTILENQEVFKNFQYWIEAEPSAQYPFQKQNSGNSGLKLSKSRCRSFVFLSDFA